MRMKWLHWVGPVIFFLDACLIVLRVYEGAWFWAILISIATVIALTSWVNLILDDIEINDLHRELDYIREIFRKALANEHQ